MIAILKNWAKAVVVFVTLSACSPSQSLQEYYVESSHNPNFIALDVPASILDLDIESLSEDQKKAIRSLKKLNILAYKKTTGNGAEYALEKKKVDMILKDDGFTELMKLNTSYGKGVVKYLGNGEAIDEVVIYGNSDDTGFALIRILGKNMNPAYLVHLIQALQKSDLGGTVLGGGLGQLLKS